jgi:GH15 family glucan-1,4-alpha-glucosidase
MALRLEDYALIGDTQTAALVGNDGSIDWLCLPSFDSGACFAALLGTRDHGLWRIAPALPSRPLSRRYAGNTLILATELETDAGVIRLLDFMPPRDSRPDVVRIVEGVSGAVPVRMELIIRFDYGSIVPWVRTMDGTLRAVAGPDALSLWTPVRTTGVGLTTQAEFSVSPGERVPFVLTWYPSHQSPPERIDAFSALEETQDWWDSWFARCTYSGEWRDLVGRSLIVLKALTYGPTGGILAAPTTSLPEKIGGVRNWDYRFCWLRDATFTLYALLSRGFVDEAAAWRSWLLRAVAGDPSTLQIMYGASGERRLWELELPWLPGYEGSRPVRVGNAASGQLQLDVYGEVIDMLRLARRMGLDPDPMAWALVKVLLDHLEDAWRAPDEGIWEIRGPRRHFTHSKVMAWVAFDRAVKDAEQYGLEAPLERWKAARAAIAEEVCRLGFNARRHAFTQFYGSDALDASLLMLPLVGFLPPEDPRIRGTVAAIERELVRDGFVLRYRTESGVDGLPPGEGLFLPCSFWLADNYVLQKRYGEGRQLFERLTHLANDVGLLSEQYDPATRRLVGNFPQAFTHVALINTARNLEHEEGPAHHRHR